MTRVTKDQFAHALKLSGVQRGDILHVQSDLAAIGLPDTARSRDAMLDFYLQGLQQAVGPEGTLTTCTAFEDYGRYGVPFHVDSSPSRTGALSEYMRTRPGAVRSCHPIVSVTALGHQAQDVAGGPHYDGFSYVSPWGELHRRNALIMTLGMGLDAGGLTFLHYAERLFGVPYQYTKIYDTPVFKNGQEVPGPFTMSVRYLDFGIADTGIPLKQFMVEQGTATLTPIGKSWIWMASAMNILSTIFERLSHDRWFLLVDPPKFRRGEIPFDGTTGILS